MKIVKKNQTTGFKNNNVCTAFAYPLEDKNISAALIELSGRYPDKGNVVNLECKEMAYIIKGSGKLVVEGKEFSLSEGDVILIEPGENFFWDGNMTIFMPCTPAWHTKQHKEVE